MAAGVVSTRNHIQKLTGGPLAVVRQNPAPN